MLARECHADLGPAIRAIQSADGGGIFAEAGAGFE